jgi:hypothetical protein
MWCIALLVLAKRIRTRCPVIKVSAPSVQSERWIWLSGPLALSEATAAFAGGPALFFGVVVRDRHGAEAAPVWTTAALEMAPAVTPNASVADEAECAEGLGERWGSVALHLESKP